MVVVYQMLSGWPTRSARMTRWKVTGCVDVDDEMKTEPRGELQRVVAEAVDVAGRRSRGGGDANAEPVVARVRPGRWAQAAGPALGTELAWWVETSSQGASK